MADTIEVLEQQRFNEKALDLCLCSSLVGISTNTGLKVRQYRSGQSNPTFHLQKGDKQFVLRKKPPGPLLPGAHKVDREYRVQKALFSAGFPVPQPLLYCDDVSVIGTEFYVMQHVEGRIFRDITLPEVSAAERTALYVAAVETLVKLHTYNWKALGLEGFGKGGGYCKRQVITWTKQYNSAAQTDLPAMNQLSNWLMNNLPTDDKEATLVHGDFRIDNIIFHPTESRVLAVLDWELSTVGHPLADLAYFCLPYFWPKNINYFGQTVFSSVRHTEGIPSHEELISVYCRCRGLSTPLPYWNFFLALSFFKSAGIAEGIYARHLLGNASAESAHEFVNFVKPLAEAGLSFTKSYPIELHSSTSRNIFQQTRKGERILEQVKDFMKQHIYPAEKEVAEYYAKHNNSPLRWERPPVIEKLKNKAKAEGLWNLFLPGVSGLSQLDYSFIAEEMGKCLFASEIFNCQAPDTGNMEVLHMYGTEEQKRQWLEPLLRGEIHSCFCMTEPDVASSDATNIACTIQRDGNDYVINGKKWWSSGARNPNCKIAIVLGQTGDSVQRHRKHSMILVPMDTPGVKITRALTVFGYDDAVHGGHFEVLFDNVRVPLSNMLLGEGRGFEIAQGRLGPGRIHHCMRAIGTAERALSLMCERAAQRTTFGKKLYEHEVVAHWIAECRIDIEQTRLLTLKAAKAIDVLGSAAARKEIAMIKVAVPRMTCKVVDCAIQCFGAAGVSQDFPLAVMYSMVRTLRIADGPDEVHLTAIAKMELRDQLRHLTARM
ncbi:acyl-CoA dehydrogenase family member 11 [Protopterus annectens]|uniref:acyl-CoA dehydrogenase family member 11 n=1 Tax=Protopterus annectens TaxID=7888 RepID=UPI001CFBAA1C|nr:acyl-CoA dehydrogenase family member 11 [Protopterus annectens]